MSRVYAATFDINGVTQIRDLFELNPGADRPCRIISIRISQETELGDAQEEQLHLQLIRGWTTSGSGGTTPTPIPMDQNDAAATAVVEAGNTTVASVGSPVILLDETFNVRTGWIYAPMPEERPRASNATGGRIVLRLVAAPADSIDLHGTLVFQEM